MRGTAVILFLFSSLLGFGQVESNVPLNMSGASDAERQVKQLADPLAPNQAVNAQTVQKGTLVYAQASGSNNLVVSLTPAPAAYTPGMIVNFKASNANSGAVTLDVNGLGPVSVKKAVNDNLDSADIVQDLLVSVIYDGANFQVLSGLPRKCPSGFVSVNQDYCIEINDHDTLTFFQAVVTCGDMNARLCSMSEWYFACQDPSLGLNNMLNNYEWVDEAANNVDKAKVMGLDLTGVPGCMYGYNYSPGSNYKSFRCCYSKR